MLSCISSVVLHFICFFAFHLLYCISSVILHFICYLAFRRVSCISSVIVHAQFWYIAFSLCSLIRRLHCIWLIRCNPKIEVVIRSAHLRRNLGFCGMEPAGPGRWHISHTQTRQDALFKFYQARGQKACSMGQWTTEIEGKRRMFTKTGGLVLAQGCDRNDGMAGWSRDVRETVLLQMLG